MKADSVGKEELESIFSVYKQSDDEQLIGLEKPVSGKYQIRSNEIVYKPDSAFSKGKTYRAEFRTPAFYDQKDVMIHKSLPGAADVKSQEFNF